MKITFLGGGNMACAIGLHRLHIVERADEIDHRIGAFEGLAQECTVEHIADQRLRACGDACSSVCVARQHPDPIAPREQARNQLGALQSGQRVSRFNAAGEREFLDDAARSTEIAPPTISRKKMMSWANASERGIAVNRLTGDSHTRSACSL